MKTAVRPSQEFARHLPHGIGDPIELCRRYAARGLIKYPSPAQVETELALAKANDYKASERYVKLHSHRHGELSEKIVARKVRLQNPPEEQKS